MKMINRFEKRDFWMVENQRYGQVYFRLEKCARIVNQIAQQKDCDLLDVGCGPATLAKLLNKNIHYFGIDIAIHDPTSANLMEVDFVENEIAFCGQTFDLVVAAGVFEYMGKLQNQKFAEIQKILKKDGAFIVTYSNFQHIHSLTNYPPFNNIRSINDFSRELRKYFRIERSFGASYNWQFSEPRRRFVRAVQMPLMVNLPILSSKFAINYFFICRLP